MEHNRHSLVFTGQPVSGQDLDAVKARVAVLFKLSQASVDKMFRGGPVVVKRGLDPDQARKFQQAFEKAGAKCRIVPEKDRAENPAQASAAPAPRPSASREARPPLAAPTKPESHAPEELSEEDAVRSKAKQLYIRFDEAYDRALKKNNVEKSSNINVGIAILFCCVIIAIWIFAPIKWYWPLMALLVVLGIFGYHSESVNTQFVRGFLEPIMNRSDDPALVLASFQRWKDLVGESSIKVQLDSVCEALKTENPRLRSKLEHYAEVLEQEAKRSLTAKEPPPAITPPAPLESAPEIAPAAPAAPAAQAPAGAASAPGRAQASPNQPEDPLSREIRCHISRILGKDLSLIALESSLPLSKNPLTAKNQLNDLLEKLEARYGCVLPFNASEGLSTAGDVVKVLMEELEAEGKLPGQGNGTTGSGEDRAQGAASRDDSHEEVSNGSLWPSIAGFLVAGILVVPLAKIGAGRLGLEGIWATGASLFLGVMAWGYIASALRGEK